MKKLIIFDCDGVLVDSEHLSNLAIVDCLAEIKIHMQTNEALRLFKGRKLADCLSEIEKINNCFLPISFEATLRHRMNDYFETKLQVIPGVLHALEQISLSKCVASNGPIQKTKKNLQLTKLDHFFGENIFSAYTIQKWKPEPDLFLHACKEMGSTPTQCLVIEDSEPGVRAALAGGFRVLALGLQSIHDKNVFTFQSMSELPNLINEVLAIKHC